MRLIALTAIALCSLTLTAHEEQTLNSKLEAAKTDAQRFKSALLRAQKASREQIDKLSHELQTIQQEREELQTRIAQLKNESTSHTAALKQELQIVETKANQYQVELEKARKASKNQIEKLSNELTVAHNETAQLKNELLQARKGNSAHVENLEQELKSAHSKLQKVRNELQEAKEVNAKQLKNFTAWLYTAKSEAEDLRAQLNNEDTKYQEKYAKLECKLKESYGMQQQLQLQIAQAEQNHQNELLAHKQKLLLAQVENQQMQDCMQQERMAIQQLQEQCKPLCDNRPDPSLWCWRPNICEPLSWARGELLYWTAEASDLDFALPNYSVPGATPTGQLGKLEEVKFGWAPGFRVEVGHRFKPDLWDIILRYTYEDICGDDSFNAPADPGQVLMATQNNTSNQVATYASASVDLKYSVFDLMMGRTFLPTKQLFIHPSVGLTGAWIDRDFDIKYHGLGDPSNLSHDHYDYSFSGGGMRVGVDFDWYLGKGWSISATTSVAALLGYYSNYTKANTTNTGTGNAATDVENSHYDDNRIATQIQMQLGPSWGIMWDDWGINIFAGYELNAWFNVEEVRSGDLSASTSSITQRRTVVNDSVLGFQGFVGKIQVNF
ncbi:MAG: hypothetical protein KDK50_01655 [Chlamydiia bacterium]|nr:hypothetical protein [Chlamydiia bacterium]